MAGSLTLEFIHAQNLKIGLVDAIPLRTFSGERTLFSDCIFIGIVIGQTNSSEGLLIWLFLPVHLYIVQKIEIFKYLQGTATFCGGMGVYM